MNRLLPAALLALLLLAPTTSHADAMGHAGEVVIRSDFGFNTSYVKQEKSSEGVTTLSLSPALDYFAAPGLSIGGQLLLSYTKQGDASATFFGIGPRVGYYASIGSGLGIWPQLAFLYGTSKGSASTTSHSSTALLFSLPFVIDIAPHFFLGIGPYLGRDLSGDDKTTTIGLLGQIGGHF
jgi:hypothetical protein